MLSGHAPLISWVAANDVMVTAQLAQRPNIPPHYGNSSIEQKLGLVKGTHRLAGPDFPQPAPSRAAAVVDAVADEPAVQLRTTPRTCCESSPSSS
jgi:hypothetical protein